MDRNSVNKVILVGNVGADFEVRYTEKGGAVANGRLATNRRVSAGEGKYNDQTEWHKIVLFGKTAEFAEKFLKKGTLIYIEGRLQTRKWEDKEENTHYTTEVVGNVVTLLGSGKSSSSDDEGATDDAAEEVAEEAADVTTFDGEEDPF